jgi:hypothetical protein
VGLRDGIYKNDLPLGSFAMNRFYTGSIHATKKDGIAVLFACMNHEAINEVLRYSWQALPAVHRSCLS